MTCMEVWGGNSSTWSHFVVPGLDLWVYSQPCGEGDRGGDVYYLSSCASGRLTRILLGDVAGHGVEASPLATRLREIMRRNLNYLEQSRVVRLLNEQFEAASSVGRFATAIIGTYFAPTRSLTVCTAGHPPPLIYRAATCRWEPIAAVDGRDLTNMPLGVMSGQDFNSVKLTLSAGDMMLGYSDALFEARNKDGEILKANGLAEVANSLSVQSLDDFVQALLQRLRDMTPGNLVDDDATVILARANNEKVSLKNNLLAPLRYIGGLFSRD